MKYTVTIIEYKGELCVPLPRPLMKKMGWKVGDKVDVKYDKDLDGIVVRKIS